MTRSINPSRTGAEVKIRFARCENLVGEKSSAEGKNAKNFLSLFAHSIELEAVERAATSRG
jgi:hypothetical protein